MIKYLNSYEAKAIIIIILHNTNNNRINRAFAEKENKTNE